GGGICKQPCAFAHRGASFRSEAHASRGCARSQLRQNLLGPGKTASPCAAVAAALLYGPFQRGLDRRRGGVDVVAVEAQPRPQPQTVARAEPDRQYVLIGQQQARELLGLCGRYRNLITVLAGVTRA